MSVKYLSLLLIPCVPMAIASQMMAAANPYDHDAGWLFIAGFLGTMFGILGLCCVIEKPRQ